MQEEEAIARALASQIQDALQAQRVEVLVELQAGGTPVQAASNLLPGAELPQRPTLLAPLQSARSLLGEICLWRKTLAITPEEERLL